MTRLAGVPRAYAAQGRAVPLVAALVLLAGCGSDAATRTKPPDPAKARVALLQAPTRAGEIIVRGDLSPASHGPYAFDGRYVVRFEQFAPEDPHMDFTAQTAFVATLDRNAEQDGPGSVRLFRAARRTGRKALALHGRFFVDVSFGDFPYAIRITPLK
jgi:hypothetical protein